MSDNLSFHDVGALVMAHGTPAAPSEIEAFYTKIRRGSPPSAEQLSDLVRRYEAIGDLSPLAAVTVAQARALKVAFGLRMPVAVGTKFGTPTIAEGVEALRDVGVRTVVGLVMAPQYSSRTTEAYFDQVRAAVDSHEEMHALFLDEWHTDPVFIEFLNREVTSAVEQAGGSAHCHVLFTAHSLPIAGAGGSIPAKGGLDEQGELSRGIAGAGTDDPYFAQVAETARAVAQSAGLPEGSWSQVWQSAGRTSGEWIGPDVGQAIRDLPAAGVGRVVVCPVGFAAENLETLYDLDIEAASLAREVGIGFTRTAVPGADQVLFLSLAQRLTGIIMAAIQETPAGPGTGQDPAAPLTVPVTLRGR